MAKKTIAFILRALVKGCVVFTVMTVLLYAGAYVFTGNLDLLKLKIIIFTLAFSAVCGLMTEFLVTDVMSVPVRAVIHYAVTLAAFLALFVFIPGGDVRTALIRGAIFTVIWAVPFAIWFAVRSARGKKRKESEYKPAFKK